VDIATQAEHEPSEVQAAAAVFPPVGDGDGVARWTVEIIEWFPHDPEAFTQGLEMAGGTMYESTGLWGRSSLRAVTPDTGEVTARVDLPDEFFGEGLTVAGDEIFQLTWRSGTALVYDRATLEPLREHSYEGEGWGLCEMGGQLIMTDGSDRLARRDLDTFELLATVTAAASGYDGRLDNLNELECVEGMVIANVWQTDYLLVIDPDTGQVVASIDAGPLVDDAFRASAGRQIDVLNGVAVDEKTATLWMTGKLWPRLYRVRLRPSE
jgi:glutaminyl-peptide cyclotransferase